MYMHFIPANLQIQLPFSREYCRSPAKTITSVGAKAKRGSIKRIILPRTSMPADSTNC